MSNNKTQPKGPKESVNKIGWAHAFRDSAVASINRGQLPLFGFFLLLLALIWKMPQDDVSKLVFDLLASARRGELFAWVIAVLLAAGWFTHARVQRRLFGTEFDRVGREKSALQNQALGTNAQREKP
jgi:hypothetical protein